MSVLAKPELTFDSPELTFGICQFWIWWVSSGLSNVSSEIPRIFRTDIWLLSVLKCQMSVVESKCQFWNCENQTRANPDLTLLTFGVSDLERPGRSQEGARTAPGDQGEPSGETAGKLRREPREPQGDPESSERAGIATETPPRHSQGHS